MKKVQGACIILLCCVLTSCTQQKPAALHILLDVCGDSRSAAEAEAKMENFITNMAYSGIPIEAEIEVMPVTGSDRKAALQRVRTEIASGKGPDVFILSAEPRTVNAEPLFGFPECAMDDGRFLVLDELIEKAQFMEWDKLTPAVMEAGRTEDGQMLLPLTYTFPVTVFRKGEAALELSPDLTWDQVLAEGSPYLKAAAAPGSRCGSEYLSGLLGELADYPAEELLFTQEELVQRIRETLELAQSRDEKAFGELPDYQGFPMCVDFEYDFYPKKGDGSYAALRPGDPVEMAPLYSVQGGCRATIRTYGGINRNTKRPEEAFAVLDMLLSGEVQAKGALFSQDLLVGSVPTHEDLMREGCEVRFWSMTDENFQAYERARQQITSAGFGNRLTNELFQLYAKCSWRMKPEDLEKQAAETYRVMQMMLAES